MFKRHPQTLVAVPCILPVYPRWISSSSGDCWHLSSKLNLSASTRPYLLEGLSFGPDDFLTSSLSKQQGLMWVVGVWVAFLVNGSRITAVAIQTVLRTMCLLWSRPYFLRDSCIPNAAPGFCAASERRKIVQNNVSTPVKAESLTQTWWCNYQRICTRWPWERFLQDSHLLVEPWLWKTHPGCLVLTFFLLILSQSTPSAVPREYFSRERWAPVQAAAAGPLCWISVSTAMQRVGSLLPTKFLLSAEGNELT